MGGGSGQSGGGRGSGAVWLPWRPTGTGTSSQGLRLRFLRQTKRESTNPPRPDYTSLLWFHWALGSMAFTSARDPHVLVSRSLCSDVPSIALWYDYKPVSLHCNVVVTRRGHEVALLSTLISIGICLPACHPHLQDNPMQHLQHAT